MLIKSTLFVVTVVIKFPYVTSKQSQKASGSHRKFNINIRAVVEFWEIWNEIQNVARCLNMFSVSDPSYQIINEELLSD